MSEWAEATIGELAEFRKGVKVDAFDDEQPGSVPYLGAAAIDTGVATQFANPARAVLAEPSDVLMLWDGERSGLVGGNLAGVVASTVTRLRPRRTVDSGYLRHALQAKFDWIQARRTGTGVPHVPKDLATWLAIAHPLSGDEQRHIGNVLDRVDETIAASAAIIAKLKAIKLGLVIELLTGVRGPSSNESRVRTPIGSLPASWEVTSLSDVLASVQPAMRSGPFGSALLKHELVDEGVPLLGIDNVHTDRFVADFKRFVTPAKAAELSRYRVFPDDVIITIMGTVGRTCLVPDGIGEALSSKHIWTLTFDRNKYLPYLIMTQLNHAPWALAQLRKDEQGGIMSAIRSETLRSVLLPKPPIDEQVRLARILQSVDSRIAAEARSLDKMTLVKRAIADVLLSGPVRSRGSAA